jgi:hypothetical protein
VDLGVFASALYGVEQLRIQACQASQVLGVDLVGVVAPSSARVGPYAAKNEPVLT